VGSPLPPTIPSQEGAQLMGKNPGGLAKAEHDEVTEKVVEDIRG